MKKQKDLDMLVEIAREVVPFMPSDDEWREFDRWVSLYKKVISANVDGFKEWYLNWGTLHLEVTVHGPALMDSKRVGLVSIKRTFTLQPNENPKEAVTRIQAEVEAMKARVQDMVRREWEADR